MTADRRNLKRSPILTRSCPPAASPSVAAPGRGAGRGPAGAGPEAVGRWSRPARPARSRTPSAWPATWSVPRRLRTAPAVTPASPPRRPGSTRTAPPRAAGHPQPGHVDQDPPPPGVRQRRRHRPADQPGGPLRQFTRHRQHPPIGPAANPPHGNTGVIIRHLAAPVRRGIRHPRRIRPAETGVCRRAVLLTGVGGRPVLAQCRSIAIPDHLSSGLAPLVSGRSATDDTERWGHGLRPPARGLYAVRTTSG